MRSFEVREAAIDWRCDIKGKARSQKNADGGYPLPY
jgi:hypothetical protein